VHGLTLFPAIERNKDEKRKNVSTKDGDS